MTKEAIVIVSSYGDPHVADVVLKLREMGEEPIELNSEELPLHSTFRLSLGRDATSWSGTIDLRASHRTVDIEKVRSIWWRKPGRYFGLPPELSEQEREFAKEEIDHALGGLWCAIDCYWISHPANIRQGSWKLEQLQRAARYGFDVPRTLLTSDPDAAREFFEACDGEMIYKVMTDSLLGAVSLAERRPDAEISAPRETKTTRITEPELRELESVRLVPCLFQEYVPKRVEFRVTVIGDELFVAEIDSQSQDGTKVDWRRWEQGGYEIPYRKATLPTDVSDRCMALVRSYNLNFSALDLVLTPDGRHVFLENNPNGQFMWVEKLLPELKMTEALASCLVRGSHGST